MATSDFLSSNYGDFGAISSKKIRLALGFILSPWCENLHTKKRKKKKKKKKKNKLNPAGSQKIKEFLNM